MAMSMSVTIKSERRGQRFLPSPRPHHQLTLLSHERQTPGEDVHKVRKPVWVRSAVELANVHDVVLVLEDRSLVVVDVEVVGSREDGHDRGESSRLGLAVHPVTARGGGRSDVSSGLRRRVGARNVPSILSLVRTNNGQQTVPLEELAGGGVAAEEARKVSSGPPNARDGTQRQQRPSTHVKKYEQPRT
jgi:hypothetical protein